MSNNLDLRWSPTFCGASSGSKLFANVINGLQHSPLAGLGLKSPDSINSFISVIPLYRFVQKETTIICVNNCNISRKWSKNCRFCYTEDLNKIFDCWIKVNLDHGLKSEERKTVLYVGLLHLAYWSNKSAKFMDYEMLISSNHYTSMLIVVVHE